MQKAILVTGGAGFIGSNFVLDWLATQITPVVNLDRLTYAGNLMTLAGVEADERYTFVHGSIDDAGLLDSLFDEYSFSAVVHFAAESHVDRSIHGPEVFLATNILGTFELLQASLRHYRRLSGAEKESFRFLHVSTDEVFGTLSPDDPAFSETTPYAPNSPYAASKASSDHLVRAWHHTYQLPTLVTNCSNNYGPYQFPEKLIPLILSHALEGKPLPVYGDGQQVRDWLFVGDHCSAIRCVLARGSVGETYNIGGNNNQANLDVVYTVCSILDELVPDSAFKPHAGLIQMVEDRPGHDRRYAINAEKLKNTLDWEPKETFATGLRKTVAWYIENKVWLENVRSGAYTNWLATNYSKRSTAETVEAL